MFDCQSNVSDKHSQEEICFWHVKQEEEENQTIVICVALKNSKKYSYNKNKYSTTFQGCRPVFFNSGSAERIVSSNYILSS